ncbi:CBS domain-containing protein [Nevskia sp.]|uniref:magnesium transporter MgtE N-terminal domain-containing protein n=1 Tax=Nevskia sp. TaxID=1929292 RepID=UPI0025D62A16|nr:CBS domain-containing protein [Nevskia sp.]
MIWLTVRLVAEPVSLSLAFLEAHPGDAARVLERLSPNVAADLLDAIPQRLAAPVARQMLPLFSARAMDKLADDSAVGLLRAMGPQAGVALLRQMPTTRADALMNLLPAGHAVTFRLLLGYPENTVGAWADPHALALTPNVNAGYAIERLRETEHEHDALYVVDHDQRLLGVIALVELLRVTPETPLRRMMRPPTVTVPAQSLIGAMRDHVGWAGDRALPVVERGERFAGVLWQSALALALAPSTIREKRHTPADALSLLANGYWFSVAGLIEVLVSWLPGGPTPVEPMAEESAP